MITLFKPKSEEEIDNDLKKLSPVDRFTLRFKFLFKNMNSNYPYGNPKFVNELIESLRTDDIQLEISATYDSGARIFNI